MSEATSPLQSLLSAIGVRRSSAGLEPIRLPVAPPVAPSVVAADDELPRPFRRPARPKSVANRLPRSVCTTLKDLCEL